MRGDAWKCVGSAALSILTGGRVDYLPGARRPWHIEAFGRVARGKSLEETLHSFFHRSSRTVHSSELKGLYLPIDVEKVRAALVEYSKTTGKKLECRLLPLGCEKPSTNLPPWKSLESMDLRAFSTHTQRLLIRVSEVSNLNQGKESR